MRFFGQQKLLSHLQHRAVVNCGRLEKKRPATPVGEKLEDWRGKGKAGLIWGRKQIGECDENRREMK